jgi:endonuclease III
VGQGRLEHQQAKAVMVAVLLSLRSPQREEVVVDQAALVIMAVLAAAVILERQRQLAQPIRDMQEVLEVRLVALIRQVGVVEQAAQVLLEIVQLRKAALVVMR